MERGQTGRFYNSFVIKMIRDFFVLLVGLFLVELLVRLGLSLYGFYTTQENRTEQAAETLAGDIQNIMLNSGGPVASRTVYPIIERNYEQRGFDIAVEPSEVTLSSMKKQFNKEVEGIPSDWPEGRSHSSVRTLNAQQFCINCHVDAEPGDALGHVEVRRYLGDHLRTWWDSIRITGLITTGKIGLDIFILYLLLRMRMEPLMNLRSVVSALTRSNQGLSYRANVNSTDEFGELALNINDLLDRINRVMTDLYGLLNQVMGINDRLTDGSQAIQSSFEEVENAINTVKYSLSQQRRQGLVAASQRFHALSKALQQLRHDSSQANTDSFEVVVSEVNELRTEIDSLIGNLSTIADPLNIAGDAESRVRQHVLHIRELEERLASLTQEGQHLLDRLS